MAMIHYLVQVRLVRLPHADDEPDRWSSATSTMTEREVSVPFDSDDRPELTTSQAYLDAVTRAIGLLSRPVVLPPCPHCGSTNVDRGFTGLDQCNDCDGLSRNGKTLRKASDLQPGEDYAGQRFGLPDPWED